MAKWNNKPVKTHHVHHHLYVEDGVSKYKMEQCDKAQQCAEDAKRRGLGHTIQSSWKERASWQVITARTSATT